jgi:hypothetical protein
MRTVEHGRSPVSAAVLLRARVLAPMLAAAAFVGLAGGPAVGAHEGPPYPIVVDQPAGPFVVSVWADPDVGTGTFFVMIDPPPGGAVPEDTSVEVAVQPTSGRLAEASHSASRQPIRDRAQYMAEVPFDAQEMWRVRVVLKSAAGGGEVATEVEVTPPGLGRFDLVLYLFPFVAIGALWIRAVFRKRGLRAAGVR